MGIISAAIESALRAALAPESLDLVDQSAAHAGHAGAGPEGETHFAVAIVATAFEGMRPLERHRLVNAALGDLLRTRVHALSIRALTPTEAARQA